MAQSTKQKIEGALGDLRDAVEALDAEVKSQKKQKALREKYEEIRRSVDELSQVIPDVTAVTTIETFFKTVGDGMVAAQRDLDRRSIEYSKGVDAPPMPNLFRIPKVSADIKFAMTKESSERFNVLIFGESELMRETLQNSVSFEIVAAPPPPEMLEAAPAAIAAVNRPSDREAIKRELAERQSLYTAAQQAVLKGVLEDKNFERTVIVVDLGGRRLLATPTSSKPAADAKGEDIFLEVIVFSSTDDPTEDEIANHPLTATGGARWNIVKKFFLNAAEQQLTLAKEGQPR